MDKYFCFELNNAETGYVSDIVLYVLASDFEKLVNVATTVMKLNEAAVSTALARLDEAADVAIHTHFGPIVAYAIESDGCPMMQESKGMVFNQTWVNRPYLDMQEMGGNTFLETNTQQGWMHLVYYAGAYSDPLFTDIDLDYFLSQTEGE